MAIGDVLVFAGTDEELAPIRGSFGPWVVSDIDETRRSLVQTAAKITTEIVPVPTGRMMYARDADGAVVE